MDKKVSYSKYKNKIGYCDNKNLHGLENVPGGHFVFIRKIKKNGICDVNVITSLEKNSNQFNLDKIKHVKKGNTYPIPYFDANFTKWSGVTHNPIKNVDLSSIKDIDKKHIKRRHFFFIGKYCNK